MSWKAQHKVIQSVLKIWTAKSANHSAIANLQIILFYKPAIGVRPGTKFDLTCSHLDQTKKSFSLIKSL